MNHVDLMKELAGKKILFACFPADGHFNPLTGLAVYLQELGCDVRWYTSSKYAEKLKKMDVTHYPFKSAMDTSDLEKAFPHRDEIKGMVAKLKFDIVNAFIMRAPEYYADILHIYSTGFDFDLMIADVTFTAIPFVKDDLGIPVIAIGVLPLTETSKDLPPAGLGMTPSYSFLGKLKQALLRKVFDRFLFHQPNKVMHQLLDKYRIPHNKESVFDLVYKKCNLFLQSGTPGFEYYRSDLSSNVRFIGALLPFSTARQTDTWFDQRLNEYEKILIVTQGTVERDIEKLLVPTLEAFINTDTLVIATTGGTGTAELKKRFPANNLIIEDFIPFGDILPYADVYITNGGYGGVMLGIENEVPLLVAGVHEGKSEINARIGYFKLGINLKTEKPAATDIRKAVEKIMSDTSYKINVQNLAKEFSNYNPNKLCAYYLAKFFEQQRELRYNNKLKEEQIY